MRLILGLIASGTLLVLHNIIKKLVISRILRTALSLQYYMIRLFKILTYLGIGYIVLFFLLFIFIDIYLRISLHGEQNYNYEDNALQYVQTAKYIINGFIGTICNLLFNIIKFVIDRWLEFTVIFAFIFILEKKKILANHGRRTRRIHIARRNLRRIVHIDKKSKSDQKLNTATDQAQSSPALQNPNIASYPEPGQARSHSKRSIRRIDIARSNLRRILKVNK
jgi:hypothetical protein